MLKQKYKLLYGGFILMAFAVLLSGCKDKELESNLNQSEGQNIASQEQETDQVKEELKQELLDNTDIFKSHQVYCLGDSLTYGTGSGDMGIVDKLQSILGTLFDVNNNGVAGNTTTQMLARLDTDILDNNDAEYVVVWGGINDIVNDVAVATIESNLQAIYTAIDATGAKVIAINLTPFKTSAPWTSGRQTNLEAVNTWIAGTATDIDYYIDAWTVAEDPVTADTLLPLYDSGDHLHLQQDGYFAVGTEIYTEVFPDWAASSFTKISDVVKKDGWIPAS